MKVTHTDTYILHIFCQVFCHSFGQGRDQDLVALVHFFVYFADQIVDLSFDRADFYLRIEKSCRTDDLFCTEKFVLCLILSRCCRDKQDLVEFVFELIEA